MLSKIGWAAGFVAVAGYGIAQCVAAWVGITMLLSWKWALAAFIGAMFTAALPIVVGAFFGAWKVWGWHWTIAVLFSAPGLLVIVGTGVSKVAELLSRRRSESTT